MSVELNTPFVFHPEADLICAGQPDEQGFRNAVEHGVKAVLNLRPSHEMDWDEAAFLSELGVSYLQVPVASPADLSKENAQTVQAWLKQHAGESVLVHCASSNRVGALLALAAVLDGTPGDQALALGRAAGLTKMEPLVQSLINQWQAD